MSPCEYSGRTSSWGDPETTSLSMLERVKAGDAEAWRRLTGLYGPWIYRWCRKFGLQAADALDVTQEAFVGVLTNVQAYHRDRPGDTFRGWLWTITRNKVRDNLREQQRQPRAEGGSTGQQQLDLVPDPTPDIPAAEDDNSLEHRAMELVRSGVEERTWQAFWLVTVEHRKAADVAQRLGLSVQAVYDAKYRVRLRIRQELEGLFQ